MTKKILIAVTIILTGITFSQAQSTKEYQAVLKKLFELTGSEESYRIVIVQMVDIFRDNYPEAEQSLWDDLEKEFLKTSIDDLSRMLVPVYQKYLTLDDLNEMIRFYESPVGKKYAEAVPLISQESAVIGREWGEKIGEDIAKKLQEKGLKN